MTRMKSQCRKGRGSPVSSEVLRDVVDAQFLHVTVLSARGSEGIPQASDIERSGVKEVGNGQHLW